MIVQIEHVSAVDQLDSILSVPGVDGLIIGPYDLSCSMGIPGRFEDPDFLKIMDRIRSTAKKRVFPAGIHIVEPDPARMKKAVSEGYTFIAYSVDMRMLDVSARAGVLSAQSHQK